MKSFLIYTMILIIWPSMALANDPAALALQTQLQAGLDAKAGLLESQGHVLTQEGAVVVEPAGDYYAVTSPHLSLITAKGHVIKIGMLAANAVLDEAKREWTMAVALPTPIYADGTKIDMKGQATHLKMATPSMRITDWGTMLFFHADNLHLLAPMIGLFYEGADAFAPLLKAVPGGVYQIEADHDGRVVINGRDLSAMVKGMMP